MRRSTGNSSHSEHVSTAQPAYARTSSRAPRAVRRSRACALASGALYTGSRDQSVTSINTSTILTEDVEVNWFLLISGNEIFTEFSIKN